jgi:hypothetical protein
VGSLDCVFGAGTLDVTEFHVMPPAGGVDLPGAQAGGNLGAALAALADLDGDGVPDLLAGAPHSGAAHPDGGRVEALSGADAAPLWSVAGGAAGDLFGYAVAAVGDCDRDGVADVAVGAPLADAAATDAATVSVLSGADGAAIHPLHGPSPGARLGFALAPVEDFEGDGVADLLAGAPGADGGAPGSGVAWVVSARAGTVLLALQGDAAGDGFGRAVASAGDVDGDGPPDLLVGAPGGDGLATASGAAWVLSGTDGAVLHVLQGSETRARFGEAVAGPGDLDGDGVPDSTHAGAEASDATGTALCGPGDVDGDGRQDLVVGSPRTAGAPGRIDVLSGADGHVILPVVGATPGDRFGAALARVGDLDGVPGVEIAVGAPTTPGGGKLHLLHVATTWTSLGHALAGAGGAPALDAHGLLAAGTPVVLDVSAAPSGADVAVVLGVTRLDAPFKSGVMVPYPSLVLPFVADAAGGVHLVATWPAGVPPLSTLYVQAWVVDATGPAGFTATQAFKGLTPF